MTNIGVYGDGPGRSGSNTITGGPIMTWSIAIIMGGISGWLASIGMRTDAQQGIFLNIIVGCSGSIRGRFLFSSFLGGGHLRGDACDPMTVLTAFLGAVILPGIVTVVRRGRVR